MSRTLAACVVLLACLLRAASAGGQDARPVSALQAAAASAVERRAYLDALALFQAILDREPDNRAAIRGRIDTLARLGAPQLAMEYAARDARLLSAAEREALAADGVAQRIRWGTIAADTGRGPERFEALDQALSESEAVGARALDPAASLNDTERQLVLDRISALRERYRMHDAIALYEAMAARPAEIRSYAKAAAAAAYLYLERPERARDLFREALVGDPDNLEARLGLFYALAECEQHAAALAQVERTVADTPPTIDAWSRATVHDNPAYARVLSARAMAPLYANRPGEAEQRLHALSDRAPYNMDIRTDYASSMRARGWPRAAEQELRWVLAVDPDNSGTLGERAGALLEMRDYRNAEAALGLGRAIAAEDGRVVRAGRLAQVHDMRELAVEATFGRSSGGPTGTRDFGVDTHLYSSPLAYDYRFFAHAYDAQAKFADGTGRTVRAGVGLEYRSPLFIGSGEIYDGAGRGTGAGGALAYTPSDHWTIRGAIDSAAIETPLQARLAGVNASQALGEVAWRANESRGAALSYARMDFSDGNRRDITQAHWTERVVAGPVYKLDITGAIYASRNSLPGAAYFNPSRDLSPTLEFANEWLQWRRYTRAFRHRLVVAVGSYQQRGFGTGPTAGIRYEQEWEADDRLTLRYGIGRSQHPYDGVKTTRDYGYLSLNWRF